MANDATYTNDIEDRPRHRLRLPSALFIFGLAVMVWAGPLAGVCLGYKHGQPIAGFMIGATSSIMLFASIVWIMQLIYDMEACDGND